MRQLLSDVAVLELAERSRRLVLRQGLRRPRRRRGEGGDAGGRPRAPAPRALPAPQHQQARRPASPTTTPAGRSSSSSSAAADVVIESKGAGDLAGFGLARDDVRARVPVVRRRDHQRLRHDRALRRLHVVRPRRADRGVGDVPAGPLARGPGAHPRVAALCSVGHTAALGALAGTLRARASGAGAHVDVAAFEALGSIPARVCRYLGWEYAEHEPLGLAANAADTLLPIGIFPCADGYVSMMSTPQQLKEMLEVLDDDALKRGVRPTRRVLQSGDQGDPRHRAVPVAVRAHARRGHRQGAGAVSGRSRACTPRPR